MNTEIIYVKYDGIAMMGHVMDFYLEKLIKKFSDYPWGGGFKVDNFRYDDRFFYCDMISEFYEHDDYYCNFQKTESYIQGVLTGYLMAQGVEII